MAVRGAKPLPTNVKELHGTLRKHRTNKHEPKSKPGIPGCPKELSPKANVEWKRMSKQLFKMGLLTTIDRAALSLYCEAYARWIDAIQQIQKHGVVLKSPNGFPIQSPYLAIANKAADQVRLLVAEFGMSPASRTRVKAEPMEDEEDDFFKMYLNRKNTWDR
jgi:P27 family predicted phage terminase small subunit